MDQAGARACTLIIWSWDPAFIAIGLAPTTRTALSVRSSSSSMRSGGMAVPHIVFDPRVPDLLPGPASGLPPPRATRAAIARDERPHPPPMHAIACGGSSKRPSVPTLSRARGRASPNPRVAPLSRGPAGSRGQWPLPCTTLEGTDNTPRWDAALMRLRQDIAPYTAPTPHLLGGRAPDAGRVRPLHLARRALRAAVYDDDNSSARTRS